MYLLKLQHFDLRILQFELIKQDNVKIFKSKTKYYDVDRPHRQKYKKRTQKMVKNQEIFKTIL